MLTGEEGKEGGGIYRVYVYTKFFHLSRNEFSKSSPFFFLLD